MHPTIGLRVQRYGFFLKPPNLFAGFFEKVGSTYVNAPFKLLILAFKFSYFPIPLPCIQCGCTSTYVSVKSFCFFTCVKMPLVERGNEIVLIFAHNFKNKVLFGTNYHQ